MFLFVFQEHVCFGSSFHCHGILAIAEAMHASVCGSVWATALASLNVCWPERPDGWTPAAQASVVRNIYCQETMDSMDYMSM